MAARIVDYEKYCPTCAHRDLDEAKDPCHDCLQHPVNDDSRKPFYWKEIGRKKQSKQKPGS